MKKSIYILFFKRIFDIFFSIFGIAFFAPLMIFIAAIIRSNSPGPVFYRGLRTGMFGKPFRIYKFRTMVENAELIGGPSTALNDPRLTPVGKVLRKSKLDELPQLFNILIGHMSFVGPRPQVEKYTRLYQGKEMCILEVKPGLTDYASIFFIQMDVILGDEDVDKKYFSEIEPKKNKLRIKYAENCSFNVDMLILIFTLLSLFNIKHKWNIH